MCGYALGGTFEPSVKKIKHSPGAVEIFKGTYSVKTSTRDDRCFVTTDSKMWFCSHENCKIARSVKHNSSRLTDFSCVHIDEVKLGNKCTPLSLLKPELDKFVCSVALRNSIRDILNAAELTQNIGVQVSDMMFCVLGPISASNPLGYCHVRKKCVEWIHMYRPGPDQRYAGPAAYFQRGALAPPVRRNKEFIRCNEKPYCISKLLVRRTIWV